MDVLHARLRTADPLGLQRPPPLAPPLPAYGHGFGRRHARQGQPAPLALGHAHAARRGDGRRRGSFVAALGLAPLVGSEFVPQTDQGFTQLALRMPVGSSLERTDAKVRRSSHRAGHARGARRLHLGRRAGPAQPGLAEHRAQAAQGTQPQPEAGGRRHPRRHRQGPRHRRERGLRPADLRRHPGQRPRRPGARGRRVRREGAKIPGAVDVESSVKPACRPMRCA
jgi:hypothetical protein